MENNHLSLIQKNFFIIDSNNLNRVKDHLYGYSITIDGIIDNTNYSKELKLLDSTGCWVNIQRAGNFINIAQDFTGSYGLYLYKTDSYFAISNSFQFLVDYLKERVVLTLDYDYANSFLACELCSFSYADTLIKEIKMLPRNVVVSIDENNSEIFIKKIDYKEYSISLDSDEGIKQLDSWFFRWSNFIRNLKSKTNNMTFDLSGGFDSRCILAVLLASNVNMEEVQIKSSTDGLHCHSEDFLIASKIASHFGFELNKGKCIKYNDSLNSLKDIINLSFYTKLGFHKEMYFKNFVSKNNFYYFPGSGGECIRGYPYLTTSEYLNKINKKAAGYSKQCQLATNVIINKTFDALIQEYKIKDSESKLLPMYTYNDTRCRNHYAKGSVEKYLCNHITCCMLIDEDLRKIDFINNKLNDEKLLVALIYARYCPDLLDFEFEGGRYLKPATIEFAKELNKKFPFKKPDYSMKSLECEIKKIDVENKKIDVENKKIDVENNKEKLEPNKYLKKLYESTGFMNSFCKYFENKVYNKIKDELDKTNYFPLKDVYAAIAVTKAAEDAEYSLKRKSESCFDDLEVLNRNNDSENFGNNISFVELLKFITARIDFKNRGNKSNQIEIINCSDNKANISNPIWFSNEEGKGSIIHSSAQKLNLTIKCLNESNSVFTVWLRTKDIKDSNNKRIPIYVKYLKLIINDEVIFDKEKIISHDTPFKYEKKVTNGEIINIHLEWTNI